MALVKFAQAITFLWEFRKLPDGISCERRVYDIENIVIVGTGTTALTCAKKCLDMGKKVTFYDIENKSTILRKRAEAMDIPYKHFGKKEAYKEISEISEQTLMFSILNDTIVPEYVLAKQNISAVNCHRALLPKHPGRNAEVWAIYEGDKESGITWHYITKEIDGGDIIMQHSIALDDEITSYELFKRQVEAIVDTFPRLLVSILSGNSERISQSTTEKAKMHFANERPNNGELDMQWSYEKIRAFLRAMDYKGLDVVGKPYILINGDKFIWKKYQFLKTEEIEKIADDDIAIKKDEKLILLKKCKKL